MLRDSAECSPNGVLKDQLDGLIGLVQDIVQGNDGQLERFRASGDRDRPDEWTAIGKTQLVIDPGIGIATLQDRSDRIEARDCIEGEADDPRWATFDPCRGARLEREHGGASSSTIRSERTLGSPTVAWIVLATVSRASSLPSWSRSLMGSMVNAAFVCPGASTNSWGVTVQSEPNSALPLPSIVTRTSRPEGADSWTSLRP